MNKEDQKNLMKRVRKIFDPKCLDQCHYHIIKSFSASVLENSFYEEFCKSYKSDVLQEMANGICKDFSNEVITKVGDDGEHKFSIELFVMLPDELKTCVNACIMLMTDDQIQAVREGEMYTELGIDFDNSEVTQENMIEKLEELIQKSKERLEQLKGEPIKPKPIIKREI